MGVLRNRVSYVGSEFSIYLAAREGFAGGCTTTCIQLHLLHIVFAILVMMHTGKVKESLASWGWGLGYQERRKFEA